MFQHLFTQILDIFGGLSYGSILFLMALESSIFPVPSELVMIPAGYLAATGKMSVWIVVLAGTVGSLIGATVNYYVLGQWIGRPFLERYGKYLLINHKKYLQAEDLFLKNDRLYTFLGRFIPVVRHLISIPAGMFRMNFPIFLLLTGLGAGLWCAILTLLGYYFGQDVVTLVSQYTHEVSIAVVIGLVVFMVWFIRKKK